MEDAITLQAGTDKQLFGQPCVNVRVWSATLLRLATGNSTPTANRNTAVDWCAVK